jgi:hypothetical protein
LSDFTKAAEALAEALAFSHPDGLTGAARLAVEAHLAEHGERGNIIKSEYVQPGHRLWTLAMDKDVDLPFDAEVVVIRVEAGEEQ